MPMVLAASTIRVPAGTLSLWPSIVRLMSGMCGDCSHVAFMPEGVILVLLAEVPEGGVDHPARGVAKAAETAAVLQAVRNAQQSIDLDLRSLVGQDPLVGPHCPVAADAARRAFAARLKCVKLEQPVSGADDAVLVVHHDHAA